MKDVVNCHDKFITLFSLPNQSAWDLNPKSRSKTALLITSNDPIEKVLLSIPQFWDLPI